MSGGAAAYNLSPILKPFFRFHDPGIAEVELFSREAVRKYQDRRVIVAIFVIVETIREYRGYVS